MKNSINEIENTVDGMASRLQEAQAEDWIMIWRIEQWKAIIMSRLRELTTPSSTVTFMLEET